MKVELVKSEAKEGFARCVRVTTNGSVGTGVILETGLVLACYHVCRTDRKPHFWLVDTTKGIKEGKVLKRSKKTDLVLLSVPTGKIKRIEVAKKLATGDRVYCIGNPLDHRKLISHGRIVDITDKNVFSDIHAAHRSSGSAVYKKSGRFAGLVRALERDGSTRPFTAIIRLDRILEFLGW